MNETLTTREQTRQGTDKISKADVVLEIANAILRLGKNDWDGVLISLRRAEFLFKDWRKQSIQEGFHKK